jgi:hypothetical protein
MPYRRNSIGAVALVAGLLMIAPGQAFDDAEYPDLKGLWFRSVVGAPRFDTSKPRGLPQQAPLKPEFQKLYEASLADQATGGQGNHTVYRCLAWGMPAMMNGYGAGIEFVVLPNTTYVLIDDGNDSVRRIFTDGRDFPADFEPTFTGYSIGKWGATGGDGNYDVLEVETRLFKGPRVYDNTGLMLHPDNKSVINERIYLDKTDRNILVDEITVTDNALTRPWKVTKSYKRDPNPQPYWREDVCAEGNNHVFIGGENYMYSADGYLMPAKKGQRPPDLRYFNQAKK